MVVLGCGSKAGRGIFEAGLLVKAGTPWRDWPPVRLGVPLKVLWETLDAIWGNASGAEETNGELKCKALMLVEFLTCNFLLTENEATRPFARAISQARPQIRLIRKRTEELSRVHGAHTPPWQNVRCCGNDATDVNITLGTYLGPWKYSRLFQSSLQFKPPKT